MPLRRLHRLAMLVDRLHDWQAALTHALPSLTLNDVRTLLAELDGIRERLQALIVRTEEPEQPESPDAE